MTTNRIVLKAIAAATLTLIGGYAAAAGTQTIAVTASVASVCKFSGAAAAIAFTAIDPSLAADKTAAVTVPYHCTKGVTPGVTTGTITNLTNGTTTIPFTLDAFTTPAGLGFSTAVNATSFARIIQADYQDATGGAGYTGSVVVDIDN